MVENIRIFNEKIILFKSKIENKDNLFIFEPNKFDIFLDNIFKTIYLVLLKLNKYLLNKSYFMDKNNNQSEQKFLNIQKKIQDQDKIINKSIQLNYDLSNQINLLNNKINELLKHNEKKTSFIKKDTSMTKEEFFQSENLRLSNELHEARKKYEIMKVEINKFENQRSNIIKKINSLILKLRMVMF